MLAEKHFNRCPLSSPQVWRAVPSQDRERGGRESVTLVILTCPQLSFLVPRWSPQPHHPLSSPPIFPLLPSSPLFLLSCSRLSHHVGPGEDGFSVLPVSSTTKPWFLLVFFMNQSRCERGWLEGNTKFQIHKGRECWWAQG